MEQQETHPNNKLIDRLGEPFPLDTLVNQLADKNRDDMKSPSNIIIALTTLTVSQSSAQTPLDKASLSTTARVTREAVTQFVPGFQQCHRHV